MKKYLWLLLLLMIATSACSIKKFPNKPNTLSNGTSSEPLTANGSADQNIKKFANVEELRQFMNQRQAYGRGGGQEMMALDASLPTGAVAKSMAPTAQGGDSANSTITYTETNNQVKGVEEPDIVKTNGQLLFYARNNSVEIIQSYPATSSAILASLKFDGPVGNIFIYNNKLAVYGTPFNFKPISPSDTGNATGTQAVAPDSGSMGKIAAMPMIWQNNNFTYLKIYNLDQPQNPQIETDLTFEGSASNARLIDNYLYLLTNKYTYDLAGGDIIPRLYKNGGEIAQSAFPSIRYFDLPYQSFSFTSVNAIDLKEKDSTPTREIFLMAGNENIFASTENLYITYTNYLNEHNLLVNKTRELIFDRLPPKDQEVIRQIDALDEAILNKDEKLSKIYVLIMRYSSSLTEAEQKQIGEEVKNAIKAEHPQLRDELVSTQIHKIKLEGLALTYQNQAQVPGRLLNQFSMDESEGNLRLATTRDQTWSQILDNQQIDSDNAVYVLDQDLKIMGSLNNLAPKERIYSARFINDRAYLVTFVQTDPLFVIDLKNPSAPKVLGELKIPGFSNYLHPIDGNTLLGLGKDTKTNEWGGVVPTNLKLALFDVSDPTAPKILDQKTIGGEGSDSAALYDHKAFLFDPSTKTLALPVGLTSNEKNQFGYAELIFNGSIILKIADSKFQDLGRINHQVGNDSSNGFDYSKAVRRNLIIEGNIYSLSQNFLKINALSNLQEIKQIKFQEAAPEPQPFQTLKSDRPVPTEIQPITDKN